MYWSYNIRPGLVLAQGGQEDQEDQGDRPWGNEFCWQQQKQKQKLAMALDATKYSTIQQSQTNSCLDHSGLGLLELDTHQLPGMPYKDLPSAPGHKMKFSNSTS